MRTRDEQAKAQRQAEAEPLRVLPQAVYVPLPCPHEECGQRRNHPGRAKAGWIQVNQAAQPPGPWFCSAHCASRWLIRQELAGLL